MKINSKEGLNFNNYSDKSNLPDISKSLEHIDMIRNSNKNSFNQNNSNPYLSLNDNKAQIINVNSVSHDRNGDVVNIQNTTTNEPSKMDLSEI